MESFLKGARHFRYTVQGRLLVLIANRVQVIGLCPYVQPVQSTHALLQRTRAIPRVVLYLLCPRFPRAAPGMQGLSRKVKRRGPLERREKCDALVVLQEELGKVGDEGALARVRARREAETVFEVARRDARQAKLERVHNDQLHGDYLPPRVGVVGDVRELLRGRRVDFLELTREDYARAPQELQAATGHFERRKASVNEVNDLGRGKKKRKGEDGKSEGVTRGWGVRRQEVSLLQCARASQKLCFHSMNTINNSFRRVAYAEKDN